MFTGVTWRKFFCCNFDNLSITDRVFVYCDFSFEKKFACFAKPTTSSFKKQQHNFFSRYFYIEVFFKYLRLIFFILFSFRHIEFFKYINVIKSIKWQQLSRRLKTLLVFNHASKHVFNSFAFLWLRFLIVGIVIREIRFMLFSNKFFKTVPLKVLHNLKQSKTNMKY